MIPKLDLELVAGPAAEVLCCRSVEGPRSFLSAAAEVVVVGSAVSALNWVEVYR